jgi:putative oxidoreductase
LSTFGAAVTLAAGESMRRGQLGDNTMDSLQRYAVPLGRLLLSSLFIWAGFGKLMNPAGAAQYFAHVNIPIPAVTVWIVIVIELIGGLAVLLGFITRWAALILAIFCLVTAFAVHLPVADQPNMVNFYKNLTMAGGFLYVFAYGAGMWSIDRATGMEKSV